ncbi:MAG: hypothetical protein UW58_C0049G0009 [Candidatus Collierbacteria bacterium GW2011_GWC2_44_30]|nr:MAG: hypothetical protein UW58_C0049G0009 [Candidatus Collierbacteria bacterium GW2011_GWC2_44_30]
MEIICLKVGSMGTNCYLVSDEKTKEAIIIDPGEEGDFISTNILENKLIPKAILLTHGHFDHCLAALELKLNFNIPIYLHQEDLFLYQKAHKSSSFWSKHAHNSIVIPAKAGIHSIDSTFLPLPIDHFLVDNEVTPPAQSVFTRPVSSSPAIPYSLMGLVVPISPTPPPPISTNPFHT